MVDNTENKNIETKVETVCEGEKREIAVNTTTPSTPTPPPFTSSSGAQVKPAANSTTAESPAKTEDLSD